MALNIEVFSKTANVGDNDVFDVDSGITIHLLYALYDDEERVGDDCERYGDLQCNQ